MKRQNILFLITVMFMILIGVFTLIREEKSVSVNENRTLQHFEHFTLKSYIKGEYQDKLESAMSDQFLGSETIKLKLKSALKIFNYNDIPGKVCKNRYVVLSDWHANYDCGDYLLYTYEKYNKEIEKTIKEKINMYNTINKNIDTYYYFIPTSKVFDFENNKYTVDVMNLLEENLKDEKSIDLLEINSYDDYKKYFYKTDHHWNHEGTYTAYKDIIRMFNKNAKIIEPNGETIFNDIIFYGSLARGSQILDYKEKFKVYNYNLPDMKILTNRKTEGYGSEEEYFKRNINREIFANHYGLYYGDDYGEVSIEANSGNRNLLIIGNSFSNSINKLIATHFNKTYDVDLRHYDYTFNKEFNIKEYVEENNIDKVLIIMDYGYLMDDNFNIEWGK